MNINDMRVQKTLKNIEDVFTALLKEKRLEKITVSELTKTAKISKGTFYHYYMDIYDLYEQMMKKNILRFMNSIDYYNLYFEDHQEFARRFHIDTEKDAKQRMYLAPEYESRFDNYWLDTLLDKILETNNPQILFGRELTEKQIIWLRMLLLCDLTAFKKWPEHYDTVCEIISEWNDQFKTSIN